MKLKRFITFLVLNQLLASFFISIALSDESSLQADSTILHAINLIFYEDYQAAQNIFDAILETHTCNPEALFFKGLIYWQQTSLMLDYRPSDDKIIKWLHRCIACADSILEQNPNDASAHLYRGGANGFLGSFYAKQKKWLKTGYYAWQGIKSLEKAIELNPQLIDTYYGLGLYHVMAGRQSAIIRFLQRLLPIPNGDLQKGLRFLKLASEKGRYTRISALSGLAFAHLYFDDNYSAAINCLQPLLKQFPENSDLLAMSINAGFCQELTAPQNNWNLLLHQTYKLEKIVKEQKLDINSWWKNKLMFIRGYGYFHQKQYDKALRLLKNYVAIYAKKGTSYLTGPGELMIGKIYDLKGQRKKAVACYKRAKSMEKIGNLHEVAKFYEKHPYTGETRSMRFSGAMTELPDRP